MAMNASTLAAAIKSAMVSNLSLANPVVTTNALIQSDLQSIANAIANAVVTHITTNAVVTLAGGCLATAVTAGAATSPVTGTGTIA